MRKIVFVCAALALSACNQAETAQPIVGGDSDAHGCKASAGYQWCAKTRQCERSWELAKARGFENTAEGFKVFCGN